MTVTYRRPHRRALPGHAGPLQLRPAAVDRERFVEEMARLPRRVTVVPDLRPGAMPGAQRVIHPPSFARTAMARSAPYRYTMVRGHMVQTRQMHLPRSHATEWMHRLDAALRAQRGNRCEVCSLVDDPENPHEWAHIAETDLSGMGRGSVHRIVDVRDHPEKYALLCKKCHKTFDYRLGPVSKQEQR